MPGVMPFFLATVCMALAAMALSGFNNSRLSKKNAQSSQGIVKVICCHSVSGSKARCFSIHWSVSFFPQVLQKRDLQPMQIFFGVTTLFVTAQPCGIAHEQATAGEYPVDVVQYHVPQITSVFLVVVPPELAGQE